MKRGKRVRVVLVGVIVVVVAAAVTLTLAALLRPREPTYQRKALSEWVELLYTPNHTQAMDSIAAIGPKAIPFLFEEARHWDSPVQGKDLSNVVFSFNSIARGVSLAGL